MGGRNETGQNGYTQLLLDGLEAAKPEETELANCLVLSRPIYQDTGKKKEWTMTVHAQPSLFQPETDAVFLASASSDLAVTARRKSLKPGDRVVLTGVISCQTIEFPNGETQTINRFVLTPHSAVTYLSLRVEISQSLRSCSAKPTLSKRYATHSAEGLTEKRISSKVKKKAEEPKSVSRSGVPNRASGSFGDRGRSVSGSGNSRVAG